MSDSKKREVMVKETCLVVGFLLLEAGLWLIFPPASFIIGGLLLLWIGQPGRSAG